MLAEGTPQGKADLDARFTELYRTHLRDVYSYSYYRVGNHHDAEDLTEQTFLQAYRHFERAQAESHGRPLRPWLIRIAHNLAANLYRDRSRRPQTPIDDTTVLSAMQACGLSGYRNDGDFNVGRHLRDVLSSPIMISNDRIIANVGMASLLCGAPASLREQT